MKKWNFIDDKLELNKLYWFTDNKGTMVKGYTNDFNSIYPCGSYRRPSYKVTGYAHDKVLYGDWLYKDIRFFGLKPRFPKFMDIMKNVNYFYGILKDGIKESDFKFHAENGKLASISVKPFNYMEYCNSLTKKFIYCFMIEDFTIDETSIKWTGSDTDVEENCISFNGNCINFNEIRGVKAHGYEFIVKLKNNITVRFLRVGRN